MLQTTARKTSPYFLKTSSTSGRCYRSTKYSETPYSKRFFSIKKLKNYSLNTELLFELTYEDGEYILSSDLLNLYSNGKTLKEAHALMIDRIEDLYYDLNTDGRYSDRFLKIKAYLDSVITHE